MRLWADIAFGQFSISEKDGKKKKEHFMDCEARHFEVKIRFKWKQHLETILKVEEKEKRGRKK